MACSIRVTKDQLVEALRRSEARLVNMAAENDRLRHALAIEKANNQFHVWGSGNPQRNFDA